MNRRGTIFPRSRDAGAESEPAAPVVSADPPFADIPTPPKSLLIKRKFDERMRAPPRIPLGVNFDRRAAPVVFNGHKRKHTEFCQIRSPWMSYRKFFKEDQAGPASLAYKTIPDFPVFSVKKHKDVNQHEALQLMKTSNTNVVNIEEAFLDKGSLYLVYEYMSISLAKVIAGPSGILEEYEIAAVCHGVCTHSMRDLTPADRF